MTKTDKLVKALARGTTLTTDQIRSKFGIVNPTSTIHRLREQGLEIDTVVSITRKGQVRQYAMA